MAVVFNAIWQERQVQTAQRLLPVQVLHFARHFPGQLVFGHQRRRGHLLSVQSVVQLVGHVQEDLEGKSDPTTEPLWTSTTATDQSEFIDIKV